MFRRKLNKLGSYVLATLRSTLGITKGMLYEIRSLLRILIPRPLSAKNPFAYRFGVLQCFEGFSVQTIGLEGLVYIRQFSHEKKTLSITRQVLDGSSDFIIYANAIDNWDSGEPIDENMRNKIVDDIQRAYAWEGLKVEVDYDD